MSLRQPDEYRRIAKEILWEAGKLHDERLFDVYMDAADALMDFADLFGEEDV